MVTVSYTVAVVVVDNGCLLTLLLWSLLMMAVSTVAVVLVDDDCLLTLLLWSLLPRPGGGRGGQRQ